MSLKFSGRQIETTPGPYPDIAYGTNLIKRPLWPPVTMLMSSAIGRAQLLHLTRRDEREEKVGGWKKGAREGRRDMPGQPVAQKGGGGETSTTTTTKMTATDAGRGATRNP